MQLWWIPEFTDWHLFHRWFSEQFHRAFNSWQGKGKLSALTFNFGASRDLYFEMSPIASRHISNRTNRARINPTLSHFSILLPPLGLIYNSILIKHVHLVAPLIGCIAPAGESTGRSDCRRIKFSFPYIMQRQRARFPTRLWHCSNWPRDGRKTEKLDRHHYGVYLFIDLFEENCVGCI